VKSIFVAIFVLLLLSAGIAYGLKELLTFWSGFCLAVVTQFILIYLWLTHQYFKLERLNRNNSEEIEKILEQQTALVECPCGKYTAKEVLFVTGDNIFDCPECKNQFRVNIDLTPVLITNPISAERIFSELQAQAEAQKERELSDNIQDESEYKI